MSDGTKQTVRDLRRANRATLLRHLHVHGPLSRQELGPATGLSSGSVSNVTAELLADGLLEEAGSVESDGGRPRTLLRVRPAGGRLIGVDVGETGVQVELFDLTLRELARAGYPWDAEHPPEGDGRGAAARVAGRIGAGITAVLAAGGRDVPGAEAAGPLLGVGVGVPGIVARDAGGAAVVHGQTVGWDGVPLEALVREAAALPDEVPCLIDNGARTFGRAEMWFGAGRGTRDAVVALIGSGVGACVVTGGMPYGGAGSAAGEWGHTTVQAGGRRCRCGARGCLEAYTGAWAVLERWAEAGGSPPGGQRAALAALLAAAEAEGAAEGALLSETAEYLGVGIANLVNLFSPDRIIVGGWAGLLLGPRLLPEIRTAATAYALRHPAGRVSIELCRLGPDAVTVGAATLPLAAFLARGGIAAAPRPAAAPAAVLPAG